MTMSTALRALGRAATGSEPARARRFDGLGVSRRDRLILALTAHHLGTEDAEIGEALRALREAVEELIPAGRIYFLGQTEQGPVVGSLVSGIGLADGRGSALIVRVQHPGQWTSLGRLTP